MGSTIGKILPLAITLIFITACSTSNTVRFGKKTDDEESKKTSVRFTADDDSLIVDLNLDLKDSDEYPDDEPVIPAFSLLAKEYQDNIDIPGFDYTTIREKMLMEIIKYFGTPYKYGGTTKAGMDCSAFTQILFKDVFNISLERSARLQYNQGRPVDSEDKLMFGDLVFFNTRKRVKPGHVGIYIGDNLFAHASTKKGVTITALDYEYYAKRYMGARRFESNGITEKVN